MVGRDPPLHHITIEIQTEPDFQFLMNGPLLDTWCVIQKLYTMATMETIFRSGPPCIHLRKAFLLCHTAVDAVMHRALS